MGPGGGFLVLVPWMAFVLGVWLVTNNISTVSIAPIAPTDNSVGEKAMESEQSGVVCRASSPKIVETQANRAATRSCIWYGRLYLEEIDGSAITDCHSRLLRPNKTPYFRPESERHVYPIVSIPALDQALPPILLDDRGHSASCGTWQWTKGVAIKVDNRFRQHKLVPEAAKSV